MKRGIQRKFNITVEQTNGIGQWTWTAYIRQRGKGVVFEKHGMLLDPVLKDTGTWILEQQDKAAS